MKARLFELICACAFALAQPLFDLLGQNPEFLVAHRLYGASLLLFTLGLITLPPLFLWAAELATQRLRPVLTGGLHHGLLALLFAMTALAPLKRNVALSAAVPIIVALLAGALASWLVWKKPGGRTLLRLGAVSALLFAGLFLVRPDVWLLVTASPESGTANRVGSESDTSVLMIIVDALPTASILDARGAIDARQFPNFAALAADGVWFKNASTSADFTTEAVPAILSGRFPSGSPSAHWSSYPDNLFTLLGPTHEVIASEWVTSLCPPDLDRSAAGNGDLATLLGDIRLVYAHAVLPEPLLRGLPPIDTGWRAFGHGNQGVLGSGTLGQKVAHVDSFIERIAPNDQPLFAFLHTVLPHRPYGLYPSGRYYSSTGTELGGRIEDRRRVADEQAALHAWQRHMLQTAYVDRRLGEIITRWREAGQYEQSLIVVVADHGVNFTPRHPARHLGKVNAGKVLPVPLLMKLPASERAGEVSLANVETIDILPTIANVLGLPVDFEIDGQNALDQSTKPRAMKRAVASASGRTFEFEPDLTGDVQETALRRIRTFESAEHDLIGRPVGDFELVSEGAVGFGSDSPMDVSVEPDDLLLPGEACGFVRVRRHGYKDMQIVVAVDGIIRAVTRPYRPWTGQELAVWYALLPEEALPPGDHRIEPFLVDRTGDHIRLRPTDDTGPAPSYLGLPLGTTTHLGVATEGILESKGRADDHVRLEVPLRDGEHPRSLRVRIEALDPEGTDITISVNGSRVLQARLDAGEFRDTVMLDGLTPGEPVRIDLQGFPLSVDPGLEWTFGTVEIRLDH